MASHDQTLKKQKTDKLFWLGLLLFSTIPGIYAVLSDISNMMAIIAVLVSVLMAYITGMNKSIHDPNYKFLAAGGVLEFEEEKQQLQQSDMSVYQYFPQLDERIEGTELEGSARKLGDRGLLIVGTDGFLIGKVAKYADSDDHANMRRAAFQVINGGEK